MKKEPTTKSSWIPEAKIPVLADTSFPVVGAIGQCLARINWYICI